MRRKIIGYDKTLELLKQGYELRETPINYNLYMYLGEEIITIRKDVLSKLIQNNIKLNRKNENWVEIYTLKEMNK